MKHSLFMFHEGLSLGGSPAPPADRLRWGKRIDDASREQSDAARPELTAHIENPDSCKAVFPGWPTWWYDMPQVLYSFFDEYDFPTKMKRRITPALCISRHHQNDFYGTIYYCGHDLCGVVYNTDTLFSIDIVCPIRRLHIDRCTAEINQEPHHSLSA